MNSVLLCVRAARPLGPGAGGARHTHDNDRCEQTTVCTTRHLKPPYNYSRLWKVRRLCVMPVLQIGHVGGSCAAQSVHHTLCEHGRKTQLGGLLAHRRQSIAAIEPGFGGAAAAGALAGCSAPCWRCESSPSAAADGAAAAGAPGWAAAAAAVWWRRLWRQWRRQRRPAPTRRPAAASAASAAAAATCRRSRWDRPGRFGAWSPRRCGRWGRDRGARRSACTRPRARRA